MRRLKESEFLELVECLLDIIADYADHRPTCKKIKSAIDGSDRGHRVECTCGLQPQVDVINTQYNVNVLAAAAVHGDLITMIREKQNANGKKLPSEL